MNFDLSEEHRLVEQSTREWAAQEVAPRIQQLDREHTIRSRAACRRWPSSACSASACRPSTAARGWTTSASALACEELEYVDTSLRVILSVHVGLNCLTLLAWGTEAQKQKYLVPQAQGTLHRHATASPSRRPAAMRAAFRRPPKSAAIAMC